MHIILLYLLLLPIVADINLKLVGCLFIWRKNKWQNYILNTSKKIKSSELLKSLSLRIQTICVKKTGFWYVRTKIVL